MLRLYFTKDDLANTQVSGTVDHLCEAVLSLRMLRSRDDGGWFSTWRKRTQRLLALAEAQRSRWPEELLSAVADPDELWDLFGSTEPSAVDETITGNPVPKDCWRIGGDEPPEDRLPADFAQYCEIAIQPWSLDLHRAIDADRAYRLRARSKEGANGILATLRPAARWKPPVLELEHPTETSVHLKGFGVLLQPALFCQRAQVRWFGAGRRPVLLYPARLQQHAPLRPDETPLWRPLTALLGATRAVVLFEIASGVAISTTEIAKRAHISLATASQHATVLRNAGLTASRRCGSCVLHTLTPLGTAMIRRIEAVVPQ